MWRRDPGRMRSVSFLGVAEGDTAIHVPVAPHVAVAPPPSACTPGWMWRTISGTWVWYAGLLLGRESPSSMLMMQVIAKRSALDETHGPDHSNHY